MKHFSPTLTALLVLATGTVVFSACAGSYRLDTSVTPIDALPTVVLAERWRREVVRPRFMEYRPQEWAAAGFGADGTVYIGSSARRLLAMRASDGEILWTLPTDGPVYSQPIYEESTGTVYFGADDGHMYAVDARSGKVRWRHATKGTIHRPPVYSEGALFFTTGEGRLYAVDARSGAWRWQYDRETPEGFTIQGYAGATAADGVAYTGFADGTIVALRALSGDVIWTKSLRGEKAQFVDVDTTPVVGNGLLFAASYATGVYALSPDSGSVRWHHPVEGVTGLLLHGGRLFFTAPKEGVVSLDLSGRQVWRQTLARGVPAAPAAIGPYLFVTGSESGLYVVSARTGRLHQFFDPGRGISAPPAANDELVVVLSNRGWVHSFALTSTTARVAAAVGSSTF